MVICIVLACYWILILVYVYEFSILYGVGLTVLISYLVDVNG